jgi:carboxylesterase
MEWNEPLYRVSTGVKGRTGVLLMHGFGGSPCSLQEAAVRFAEAGYSVALPLLTGHGLNPEALERALWREWTADVETALAWLRERTDRIFLFGLSMGGALALWLAERHSSVAGVISVNTLIRHPRELAMHVLGRIGIPRWVGAVGNDIKMTGSDEGSYDRLPSRATRQMALLLATARRDLSLVRCPVLLFSSVTDHVVPPANQREIYARIASTEKELVELYDSYHVATMDNDKEIIFAKTLEFIAARAGEGSKGAIGIARV